MTTLTGRGTALPAEESRAGALLLLRTTGALTPGYFDLPAGSSAGRGAALAAGAVAAVRAVFDLRRS